MCGRFSHSDKMALLYDLVSVAALGMRARYNIAPTQEVPVLLPTGGKMDLFPLRWGLVPNWARDASGAARLINARSETVQEKSAFRNAFRLRRCLVPADGWFEWQTIGRAKLPWRVCAARGDGLLAFAGLHERWLAPPAEPGCFRDGRALNTFTILTTEAPSALSWLHDRMPCLIHRHNWQEWLDPATPTARLHELLLPADPADLSVYRVTTKMNSPRFDEPEAIQPLTVPDLFSS